MITDTLLLRVKGEYFHQIKSGLKTEEYRKTTDYWRKRIEGREFSKVVIAWGYKSRDDASAYLEFPWAGYEVKTITHPHFENEATEVFAIKLER